MGPQTQSRVYGVDLQLDESESEQVINMVDDPALDTDSKKIGAVAVTCLKELANGGVLLTAAEVEHIAASTGVRLSCAEDILPFVANGSGYSGGKMVVHIEIDPADVEAHEGIARTQDRTVQELFQETLNSALDQEWDYQLTPEQRPLRILMSPREAEELSTMLGGKFSTGRELSALLRGALDMDNVLEPAGKSNVGQVA